MIVGLFAAITYMIYFNSCVVKWNDDWLPFHIKLVGFFISLFSGSFIFLITTLLVENIKII